MGRGIWRVSLKLLAETLRLPDAEKTKLVHVAYDKDWDCLCLTVEHHDIPERSPLTFCRPSGAPFTAWEQDWVLRRRNKEKTG